MNELCLQLARERGHYDLAEILSAHSQNPSRMPHIYDFIKHGSGQQTGYSGPDPDRAAYKVTTEQLL